MLKCILTKHFSYIMRSFVNNLEADILDKNKSFSILVSLDLLLILLILMLADTLLQRPSIQRIYSIQRIEYKILPLMQQTIIVFSQTQTFSSGYRQEGCADLFVFNSIKQACITSQYQPFSTVDQYPSQPE